MPEWLDLSATVVGAFAGVLMGKRYRLDLVGFVAVCLICALGGGMLRDAIMQVGSVDALDSPWPIPLCVLTALVGFLFPSAVSHFPNLYEWVDMTSVALYVIAGTNKAIEHELFASSVILMGTITGVGGGMLCDVFLGEVPRVFRRSNYYALCAVFGSICYYLLVRIWGSDQTASSVATVAVVLLLRQLSLRLDLKSPAEVDLEPKIVNTGKRVVSRALEHRHSNDDEQDGETEK
jgi:uncharacterized membrane protein YeiH